MIRKKIQAIAISLQGILLTAFASASAKAQRAKAAPSRGQNSVETIWYVLGAAALGGIITGFMTGWIQEQIARLTSFGG